MASKIKLTNILVDLLCFLVVLVLVIASEVFIYGTDEGLYPFKRNFLCGDTSIQWPKKESTVPFSINAALSFVVPIVVIFIVEVSNNMGKSENDQEDEEPESFGFFSLKPWVTNMFSLIFVFVFGGFLSQIVTDLSKLTVGRLRPSFMAACKANLTGPDCQGYVTRDVCTGDLFEIKLASMSFPSGHSSISMYGMLFLALYLQAAVRTETKLLKPLLQVVAVSLSLFVGWSRIADNKHFLTDVLAGFVLGAIFAWFVAFKILKLFAIRIRKPKVYTLLPQQQRTSASDE